MALMVAHCDSYSGRCSKTILMARSRTSGEYFGSFFIAPSSQRLESPRNPGRFTIPWASNSPSSSLMGKE
uniref:tRNA/rRNA cytosine-C5-methylase n=1 Tax=Pseudomonas savastanoi pv. phaseolicola TaxID=319 RepID=Q5QFZ9_PSESH|nr:tRNA/rRNA cytosine-C5-methylase [Pseudomonas savastanoi pv. phaseolicola]